MPLEAELSRRASSYQSLTVWGWLEDWNATVIGPNEVSMNIDVQGLK